MTNPLWRPSASLQTLKARAELFGSIRVFFSARGVLEVDTPMLSKHATVDRHIDSFRAVDGRWLHTSPEFAMKRLLASGSGPIYQLCHVFRVDEAGRHHNPEFTMLEWYRPGWDHGRLMDEVEALLGALGGPPKCERLTYREAFKRHAGFDPFVEDVAAARRALESAGVAVPAGLSDWNGWLDVSMSMLVSPLLGQDQPCFVHDFPASQAALARVREDQPPVAERFELFWRGLELANGFHELTDAVEQRARFESDQYWRRMHGKEVPPYDANLIAALEEGLPPCAGVALGVDRLLMLLLDLPDVAAAMPFSAGAA
jgi:lysyl-tRNA synthetase class 2